MTNELPSMPRIVATAEMRELGLTSKEIAEVLGVSVNTVNNYAHKAIQFGLCKRKRSENGRGRYVEAAEIYREASKRMPAKAAVEVVANEMNISRRHAYSLIGEARLNKLLTPSRRKMTGTSIEFKKMLSDATVQWIMDQTVDGMSDLEFAAILLNEAYLAHIGEED